SGHRIVSSIEAHPRGFVDAERMGLLVRNLLEEANSRARPGSDVALRLTEDGESAEIRTEYARLDEADDSGIGQGDESLRAVGEELDEHPGLRVGRHVIERIAEAHGGTCGTDARASGALSEWVRVPLVEHPAH